MNRRAGITLAALLAVCGVTAAQDTAPADTLSASAWTTDDPAESRVRRCSLAGYASDMPSVTMTDPASPLMWDNQLQARLNFRWNPFEHWQLDAGLRTRFIAGDMLSMPGYAESIGFDRGRADLSWNIAKGEKVLLNAALDRLFVTFEGGKWNVKLGRQRVNWGQTLVWNPNDIFNTYSYFDIDYPERPGCDALRVTFYHNETASTEAAASLDRYNRVTAAMLHRWNRRGVDYQIIGGVLDAGGSLPPAAEASGGAFPQGDVLVGGAVTGEVKGVNLRAEATYYQPLRNFADTLGTIAASLGVDYIFSNSLMLQAEVLYNNVGAAFGDAGILALYTAPLSSKYLSVSDWTIFGAASYPVTPRFTAAVSSMYFTDIRTVYVGADLSFSLAESLDLSAFVQYFTGNPGVKTRAAMAFLRLKYSF